MGLCPAVYPCVVMISGGCWVDGDVRLFPHLSSGVFLVPFSSDPFRNLCAALSDTNLLCIFYNCKDWCGYHQRMLMQKHLTDIVQPFEILMVLTGSTSRVSLHKFSQTCHNFDYAGRILDSRSATETNPCTPPALSSAENFLLNSQQCFRVFRAHKTCILHRCRRRRRHASSTPCWGMARQLVGMHGILGAVTPDSESNYSNSRHCNWQGKRVENKGEEASLGFIIKCSLLLRAGVTRRLHFWDESVVLGSELCEITSKGRYCTELNGFSGCKCTFCAKKLEWSCSLLHISGSRMLNIEPHSDHMPWTDGYVLEDVEGGEG